MRPPHPAGLIVYLHSSDCKWHSSTISDQIQKSCLQPVVLKQTHRKDFPPPSNSYFLFMIVDETICPDMRKDNKKPICQLISNLQIYLFIYITADYDILQKGIKRGDAETEHYTKGGSAKTQQRIKSAPRPLYFI